MWKDFKSFAMRGNVMDLAVGVVIGGAFGKIVSSLVGDIIMPLIGLLTAGADFKSLAWVAKEAIMVGDVISKPAVLIKYGMFLQNVFDFIIIALTIFLFIRALSRRRRIQEEIEKQQAAEKAVEKARLDALEPKQLSVPELLLEIRDLLKAEKETAK